MHNDLSNYLNSIFPGIDFTEKSNVIKKAIAQFDKVEGNKFITDNCITHLAQGDIFKNVPYIHFNPHTGDYVNTFIDAVLVSNTCDSSRKENLTFAPILPISLFNDNELSHNELKANKKFAFLYFPDIRLQDKIIDLNSFFSFPRETFENLLADQKVEKKYSLMLSGYYIYITKLVTLFCRPESEDVTRS
ncbi:hypothetical protein WN83_15160 [Listeria monocytogenes]|nr:hypothetical protein [Listeria monocytogenes]EAD4869136.1 hypothetical protein [Listeria monocytogenes]